MSNRKVLTIAGLLILLSVLVVGVVLLRIQFNRDYADAKAAIEQRELYILATLSAAPVATTPAPIPTFVPSYTPLSITNPASGLPTLILPTRVGS